MPSDAHSIYQDWVDNLFSAVLEGDVERIAAQVNLPYLHQSEDTRLVIETRKDMETGFSSFLGMLRSHGVNQLVALATSAEYLSDEYIEGFHVVHCLRNGIPVLPAYTNRAVLRRSCRTWKLSEVHHGFSHGSWPVSSIHVNTRALSARAREDDARRQSTQPLALYQRFLNGLTQANVSGDFEAYCQMIEFPCSYHSIRHDMAVHGPEDIRPFFDMVTQVLRDNGVEEFARIADSAEFLSGSTICGYHTTRMMRGGGDAMEPIKSRMILHRTGTRWFLKSVTNAVLDEQFPYGRPVVTDDLVTDLEIQKRTKT